MQEEKVRIGLVGVGWFGGVRVAGARKSGAAEFVSCFDLVPERRDAFAVEHGCRAAQSLAAMLGDPEVEAILIATPHSTHLGAGRGGGGGRQAHLRREAACAHGGRGETGGRGDGEGQESSFRWATTAAVSRPIVASRR